MTCAYWGFVLMSLHLGIHWRMIMAATGKQSSRLDSGKPQHIRSWILRLLGVAVALYGLYAFVKRNIASYFFLQVHFVFFDYSEPVIFYNVTRIETYPLPKAAVRDAVYISNDCVFPVGWTVETWGRGIEKICEACKKHGVPMPEYTLHLEDIMVKFTPLMGAKVPKGQNGTLDGTLNGTLEEKILFMIKKNPHITQSQIALMIDCSERKVKRLMKMMQEDGMIERVGGRRSGQWIVK